MYHWIAGLRGLQKFGSGWWDTATRMKGSRRAGLNQLGLLALAAGMCCAGCQDARAPIERELSVGYTPVSLSAGDVVRLNFAGAPEFNQAQKIRADGKVNLPLVGEVGAAGRRLPEFQADLSRLYRLQLQNTDVVVTLESSATPILVSGAVNRPGKIILERPLTILDVIMEAGGISPIGNAKKVHLIRLNNGAHVTRVFDLRPILQGQASDAIYVKGGDMIYVEESIF